MIRLEQNRGLSCVLGLTVQLSRHEVLLEVGRGASLRDVARVGLGSCTTLQQLHPRLNLVSAALGCILLTARVQVRMLALLLLEVEHVVANLATERAHHLSHVTQLGILLLLHL